MAETGDAPATGDQRRHEWKTKGDALEALRRGMLTGGEVPARMMLQVLEDLPVANPERWNLEVLAKNSRDHAAASRSLIELVDAGAARPWDEAIPGWDGSPASEHVREHTDALRLAASELAAIRRLRNAQAKAWGDALNSWASTHEKYITAADEFFSKWIDTLGSRIARGEAYLGEPFREDDETTLRWIVNTAAFLESNSLPRVAEAWRQREQAHAGLVRRDAVERRGLSVAMAEQASDYLKMMQEAHQITTRQTIEELDQLKEAAFMCAPLLDQFPGVVPMCPGLTYQAPAPAELTEWLAAMRSAGLRALATLPKSPPSGPTSQQIQQQTDTSPAGAGGTADPSRNDAGPGGWTKRQLCKIGKISVGTFDAIRLDAGVAGRSSGGRGAVEVFTPEELQLMIRAARARNTRARVEAASEWSRLLGG